MHCQLQMQNCGNIFQAGGDSANLNKGKKRRRESLSSYKRKPGIELMDSENASVTSGPWSLLKTLCLVVCKELFNALTVNSSNLSTLYNFVAQPDKVKELNILQYREKNHFTGSCENFVPVKTCQQLTFGPT